MSLAQEAESLLLHQFSRSSKLKNLLRCLVQPSDDADKELHKLHHGHYIENATDVTLDVIGSIVGQPRLGMSDEDYRPWIKIAIYLNNSDGTAENVLAVLSILFGKRPPIRMEEYAPNDVIFTFFEYPKFPIKTLFAIIRSAAPVTTKCQFLRADPKPQDEMGLLNINKSLLAFRLDFTKFSESYFADYFEGGILHE